MKNVTTVKSGLGSTGPEIEDVNAWSNSIRIVYVHQINASIDTKNYGT